MKPTTLHCAVIMDGNGRWAAARGLPRIAGHRKGADAVRRMIEAAPGCGIRTLTLYAFSSDNWRRPPEEVNAIFVLFRNFLRQETRRCLAHGVRVTVIGRRDRLPANVVSAVEAAEFATRNCDALHVRIAVDYSSRDALVHAAQVCGASGHWSRESMGAEIGPDVDLVIRTSGEQRLSDFLLWESAYAEILFVDCLWPDFTARDLSNALDWFRSRDRRFGGIPVTALAAR